jgi:DNA-binding transcriptional regulator YiaG
VGLTVTPAEIRATRERLSLSRQQFAEALGVKVRTVEEWERAGSRNTPQPYFDRALRDLERELSGELLRD